MKSNKAKKLGSFTFLLLGISSLIGWNGILTALDFYSKQYPNFDVNFIFSIPYTVASNIVGLCIYKISAVFSMNTRIIGGSILLSIFLLILPLVAEYYTSDTAFYINLVVTFIIGCINIVVQGSSLAFASIFTNQNFIPMFFTGTGLGGVLICIMKTIFISTIDQDGEDSLFWMTLGYIIVSALFLYGVIYFYLKFRRTNYCMLFIIILRYYIRVSRQQSIAHNTSRYSWIKQIVFDDVESDTSSEKSQEDLTDEQDQTILDLKTDLINIKQSEVTNEKIKQDKQELKSDQIKKSPVAVDKKKQNKADFNYLKQVFKNISPLPQNIFFTYTFTFMLFPGVSFARKWQWDLEIQWNLTILLLIFNIGDTIGKAISGYSYSNKKFATIIVYLRLIFFASFLSMILPTINDPYMSSDYFCLINMALFAISNGYNTSVNMVLAPQVCNDDEKETVGFMMTFPLTFGILIGSFLALIFVNFGK